MTLYDDSLRLLAQREKVLDPDNFNIIFMGDSWVGKGANTSNNIFESAMTEAKRFDPLCVIHGGDIVFSGEQENFNFFIDRKNEYASNLPFFVAVGNHEVNRNVPPGPQSVENFVNTIGPLHFTLNIPDFKLTMIFLNTLYHYVRNQYGLTDEELDFLHNSLFDRQKNTLVAMHTPPRTDTLIDPDDGFIIGSERFFQEVRGKILRALVSHVHAFDTATYKGTKLILSGGGGATLNKGQIFHIVVLNIRNNQLGGQLRYKVVPTGWD